MFFILKKLHLQFCVNKIHTANGQNKVYIFQSDFEIVHYQRIRKSGKFVVVYPWSTHASLNFLRPLFISLKVRFTVTNALN